MKKVLAICFAMILVNGVAMAENLTSSKENPEFLYVLVQRLEHLREIH